DTDDKPIGLAVLIQPVLFDRVERAQTRISRRGKYHIGSAFDLRKRELFAAARIVPRRIGKPDVVADKFYIRVLGECAFFVTFLKLVNQRNIHAAEKADHAGSRFCRGEHSDQVRTFVFAKNERRNVLFRRFSVGFEYHAVNDREFDVRIIDRDLLHDRTLGKAYADDQIEILFGKGTH